MKLTKQDFSVLSIAAHPKCTTLLPWRGVYQRCWRLAQQGYLVEAGMSVMPPHKLYAITDAGRLALKNQESDRG